MVAALSVVEQMAELVEELEGVRRKGQFICACYDFMNSIFICADDGGRERG